VSAKHCEIKLQRTKAKPDWHGRDTAPFWQARQGALRQRLNSFATATEVRNSSVFAKPTTRQGKAEIPASRFLLVLPQLLIVICQTFCLADTQLILVYQLLILQCKLLILQCKLLILQYQRLIFESERLGGGYEHPVGAYELFVVAAGCLVAAAVSIAFAYKCPGLASGNLAVVFGRFVGAS
jgi:hypothetical protein